MRLNVKRARATLEAVKECQLEAGIYEHCFVSFGTCLGSVRPSKRPDGYTRGFIGHDNDMDMGVYADRITGDQEKRYIKLLEKAGLFDYRKKMTRRSDNGRLAWCSLRKYPLSKGGVKMCHWFWFKHRGYYWHSKGGRWVSDLKFPVRQYHYKPNIEAIAKGTPAKYLEETMEVSFEGGKYNVPVMSGHCLDLWYPGWLVPKEGGTSSKKILLFIGRWSDKHSWRVTTK